MSSHAPLLREFEVHPASQKGTTAAELLDDVVNAAPSTPGVQVQSHFTPEDSSGDTSVAQSGVEAESGRTCIKQKVTPLPTSVAQWDRSKGGLMVRLLPSTLAGDADTSSDRRSSTVPSVRATMNLDHANTALGLWRGWASDERGEN